MTMQRSTSAEDARNGWQGRGRGGGRRGQACSPSRPRAWPPPPASYAEAAARAARGGVREAFHLALLAAFWCACAWRLRAHAAERAYCLVALASAAGAMLWALCSPAGYRRQRTRAVAALQLQLSLLVMVADPSRLLGAALPSLDRGWAAAGGCPAARGPSRVLLVTAGSLLATLQGALSFEPPPMLAAGLHLAAAAVTAWPAAASCAAQALAGSDVLPLAEASYRLLGLIVPPLAPQRPPAGPPEGQQLEGSCLCVTAALQFWLVLVLPTVLVWRRHAVRYRSWHSLQRRADRERRRKQAAEWGFGFQEPSSGSSGGSSAADSGGSERARILANTLPPTAFSRWAAGRGGRHRRGLPVPHADRQYALAARVTQPPWRAVALAAAAALPLYAWHLATALPWAGSFSFLGSADAQPFAGMHPRHYPS